MTLPARSRIKKIEDGPRTTIHIPPVGWGPATSGWVIGLGVSAAWTVGLISMVKAQLVPTEPPSDGLPLQMAVPMAFLLAGMAVFSVLRLLDCFGARATLTIEKGRLAIEQRRPLGVSSRVFEPGEEPCASCQASNVSVNRQRLYELCIRVRSGQVGYFTGRPVPELEWLAEEVNQALVRQASP